jgi:periplasmic protein TonB
MKTKHAESLEEIIFKGRNKDYGAYSLRKNYGNHVIIALFIAVLFIGSALTYPLMMKPADVPDKINKDTITIVVTPFKYPDLPPPLKFPAAPPAPKIADKPLAFRAPKVTETGENTDLGKQDQYSDQKPVAVSPTPVGVGPQPEKPEPALVTQEKPVPLTIVEEMPQFPQGVSGLKAYLLGHIRYPQEAKELNTQGFVFVTFVVEPDGSITGVKLLRGIGSGCDEEAVRVVRDMPKWTPGKQNGIPVRVQFNLPIKFTLQ